MNTKSSLAIELSNKEYRDAFVASQLRIGLPMQCRALRESRDWTQPRLAEAAGMSQPRISEIERPGKCKLNLETLLRLASAYDVALQVRFVPFSKFIDDDDHLDLDNFRVPAFEEDMAQLENLSIQMQSVHILRPSMITKALISAEQSPIEPEERNQEDASPDARWENATPGILNRKGVVYGALRSAIS